MKGMRVVGGSARGRRLSAPDGLDVRPTGDRVREALFNALGSMGEVVDRTFVDLYAGSGALGIEALSRGAAHCVFVDSSRRSIRAVESNVESLGFGARAHIVNDDARRFVNAADQAFDVALADPPYVFDDWPELLVAVPARIVVVESNRSIVAPADGTVLRERSYGGTVLTIIQLTGRDPRPSASEDAK